MVKGVQKKPVRGNERGKPIILLCHSELFKKKAAQNQEKSSYSRRIRGFLLVRVAGFEPTASWTRTKRDTKLRHTRMPKQTLFIIVDKRPICQEDARDFLRPFVGVQYKLDSRGRKE